MDLDWQKLDNYNQMFQQWKAELFPRGEYAHRNECCFAFAHLLSKKAKEQGMLPLKIWCLKSYDADIICMQEVVYDSDAFMEENLKEYFAFGFPGPEMDPYTEGYHNIAKNVIFFRKSRYEFVSSGSYWLSETPLIAGSCSWNTNRARHCNWVRIRDRKPSTSNTSGRTGIR